MKTNQLDLLGTRFYKGPEILVFGIDGASFDYINPIMSKGDMPNLARLIEHGVSGVLESVMPPQTPSAWSSFITGKNPGKHSIFGWSYPSKEDNKLIPVTSQNVHGVPLWTILSRAGKTVGVVNCPLTYPATRLNGFMISGFDNPFNLPAWEKNISYPENLLHEIRKKCCAYKIIELFDPKKSPTYQAHLEDWKKMEKNRTKAACYLIDRYQPEFMMVVHHIADYFHHRAKSTSEIISDVYKCVDESLGELLAKCSDDTIIIVVSDHGATEIQKFIYLHNWLVTKGFLKFNDTVANENIKPVIHGFFNRFDITLDEEEMQLLVEKLSVFWRELPRKTKASLTASIQKFFPGCNMSHSNIDWTNTKAFTCSDYGQIYINLKGRQPNGIVEPGDEYDGLVETIIGELNQLEDPENRHRILSHVVRKEAIYKGTHVVDAPDIACFLADYTYYFCQIYPFYLNQEVTIGKIEDVVKEPEHSFIGDHTPEGILVAAGKGLKARTKVSGAKIVDLAPTILYMFGLPIPADMDGMVIKDLFQHFDEKLHRVKALTKKQAVSSSQKKEYTQEDMDELRRKLRTVGYRV